MLNKILIKSKRAVFSDIIGENITLLKGEGYDFIELREYTNGEDIKKIDWTISAKMQKPYVKVFHSQRELNISIVPILNGSVHFGTIKLKQEIIASICAILGYSCIKQNDNFNSFIANEQIVLNTKKTKRFFGVSQMVEKVLNYNVLNKQVDYKKIINDLFNLVYKKSIIFLIGDFFDISSLDLRVLSKKHEVFVIIVRDKFEEQPKALGHIHLKDPQNSEIFDGELNNTLIQNYVNQIHHNDHLLYNHLQKCNIRFTKIYTDEEPIVKLITLMRK